MNLIHYAPWRAMHRLHRDMERLFSAPLPSGQSADTTEPSEWLPAVDINEEADRFVLRADMPGVEPEDLEITTEGRVLAIRGKRDTRRDNEQSGLRRVERASGRFLRRFTLPEAADRSGINADYRNGVLELSIPKQPLPQPQRIEIKSH